MSRAGAAAAVLLALALLPGPAGAQGTGGEPGAPPVAGAPDQFRLSVIGAWVEWDAPGEAGGQEIEGAAAWGLELETRVVRFLSFRFGGAFGGTEISGTDADGARRAVEAGQWVLELVAEPRLAVEPLREAGVVPFGVAGLGSVVHDPRTEEGEFRTPLVTRSQGSVIYGGGLEVEPAAPGGFGARLELRRAEVRVQDLFVSTEREGTERSSSRLMGTVYLAF